MTVYPIIFNVGPLQITGYGIMMMIGFLMGGWLIGLELKRRGLREDYAGEIVVAAVIGGIVGAKLWYVFLMGDPRALFSRGGLVWYGGFLGGTLAVILNGLRLKIPTRWTAQLMGPPLAAAYALGRVGCFLVNDDYGRPTEVAWAVKFPQGMPPSTAGNMERMFGIAMPQGMDPTTVLAVHPTQLYEVAAMLVAFAILWTLRKRQAGTGWLFGLYLMFAGVERFVIEFLRAKDDRIFGAFTLAQVTSVALVLVGAYLVSALYGAKEVSPGAYLQGA
jgi:phosphatidylglycerol:prolipoprotein diacylglycerol transferase